MTNTRKTPAEIAEAARIAYEKAQARAAKAAAKESPALAPIQAELDIVNKQIAAISRKTSGPNSFDNRLASAQARLNRIVAEQNLALAEDRYLRILKDYYQERSSALAQMVADGVASSTLDIFVKDTMESVPLESAELPAARIAYIDADLAWRESTPANLRKSSDSEEATATA